MAQAGAVGDQNRPGYIHLKEVYVDFIKRRPTSVLELVFKDHAGVKHKSHKFKQGDLVHWNIDTYVRTHTSATLTIRRAIFNISVAEISVQLMPMPLMLNAFTDNNYCVTVTFVCGISSSLENVARVGVFGPEAYTVLEYMIPIYSEHPPFAGLPPRYDGGIRRLNDDILLGIFNCYRMDEQNGWNDQLGWRKLSHVCQRWRHLIYDSSFHLGMHIKCTNGTPIVDTLDHLPPLPLLVDYQDPSMRTGALTEQDILGMYHALRLHDRVHHISLRLPPSILHKCLALMDNRYPILKHLSLWFAVVADDNFTTITLPKAFLAPNLRHISLPGISPPRRLRLLTSTVSLTTLVLSNIETSSYFRPKLLVARLSSLPQLEELSIYFSIPLPRPSAERELLGGQEPPVTLLNVKTLAFQGVSAYLESLIAKIRAPLLERLEIVLFNQIAFALPHLSRLIDSTEGFKVPAAKISFDPSVVSIIMAHHGSQWSDGPFFLRLMCEQLDWQIDCIAQICSALIPTLSHVQQFTLDFYKLKMPIEWQNGEIDGTSWHELLRSFIGVKELRIEDGLLEEVSRALQEDELGSDPGFLPNLQDIVAADNLFASFTDIRRIVGRPVQYSGRFQHQQEHQHQPPPLPRFPLASPLGPAVPFGPPQTDYNRLPI